MAKAMILHAYIMHFFLGTGERRIILSPFYFLNDVHCTTCVMEVENNRVLPLTEIFIERLYMLWKVGCCLIEKVMH